MSKKDKEETFSDKYDGRLYAINKWEFAHQIGSATLYKHGNLVSILLSHPGGTVSQITELPNSNLNSAPADAQSNQENTSGSANGRKINSNSLFPTVLGASSNAGTGLGSGISSPMTDGEHPSM